MKPRHLKSAILKFAKEYPTIAIVGPRQSGKTTLAKALFKNHKYLSLENLDLRNRAIEDPRGFLSDFGNRLILDEVQRAPELFSYLQELVDTDSSPGQYILTGSHQFLLFEGISQSLAGRIATFKLFPFTYTELKEYPADESDQQIYQSVHKKRDSVPSQDLYNFLFKGFYPRIYDQNLNSRKWVENYVLTYVERDIRTLINIKDLHLFDTFLKRTAAQTGQILNYASISNAVGISQPTAKDWLSILETSGLVFQLPPFFKNFSKRLTKRPKLYFLDTGILCYLLNIRNSEDLKAHPLRGQIFETFIVSECYKRFCHLGEIPPLYFWRDKLGHEIDLIIDRGKEILPIEIKSSQTYNSSFCDPLKKWIDLKENQTTKGLIVYAGDHVVGSQSVTPAVPWYML